VEILKKHAFWFLMGGVVLLLVAAYILGVVPLAGTVKTHKEELDKRKNELQGWANKGRKIKTPVWIEWANQQEKTLADELAKCDQFFATLQIPAPLAAITDKVEYRNEYEKASSQILQKAQKSMLLAKDAFDFRQFESGDLPTLDEMSPLAKELTIQDRLTDILANSQVKQVEELRFGSLGTSTGATKSHASTRIMNLYDERAIGIRLYIAYKDINKLLQQILAAKTVFLIRSFSFEAVEREAADAVRTGAAGTGGTMPAPESRAKKSSAEIQKEKLVRMTLKLAVCDFSQPAAPTAAPAKTTP
jgi:hypothetical protein